MHTKTLKDIYKLFDNCERFVYSQSKYFVPLTDHYINAEGDGNLTFSVTSSLESIQALGGGRSQLQSLLIGGLNRLNIRSAGMRLTISLHKLQSYQIIEEFHELGNLQLEAADKDGNVRGIIDRNLVFFVPEYEVFLRAYIGLDDYFQRDALVFHVADIYYNSLVTKDIAAKFSAFYLNDLKISSDIRPSQASIGVLMTGSNGRLKVFNRDVKPMKIDIDKMYADGFSQVSDKIIHDLTNKSKGVTILHGVPGSGKTNYIKWLTSQVQKKFLFIPNTMISVLDKPEFITLLIESSVDVIVIEDCENYIRSREAADNNIISTILNISDGMLSDILECQFICTFNAPLDYIDEALLRKGRLNVEYCFPKLPVEKSNKLIKSLGSDFVTTKEMTLAEITNLNDITTFTTGVKTESLPFGFI